MNIDNWIRSCVQANRTLFRNPLYACCAIVLLALGMGVSTTILSIVSAVLLKPLPYPRSEDLLLISSRPIHETGVRRLLSPAEVEQLQSETVFDSTAAYTDAVANLGKPGLPAQRVSGILATDNFLGELGQPLAYGRGFSGQEQRDESGVAVISYALWQQLFPSQSFFPNAKVRLDGAAYTIVGVLKPGMFFWANRLDFVLPLHLTEQIDANTQSRYLVAIGRVRRGHNLTSVRTALSRLSSSLAQQHPASNASEELTAESLRNYLVQPVEKPILLMSGAVVLFLLIACANVAGLMLARLYSRRSELLIRVALGATNEQLAASIWSEAGILCCAGTALGFSIGWFSLQLIRDTNAFRIPRLETAVINGWVFAISALLALFLTALIGLLTMAQMRDMNASEGLKQALRGGTTVHTNSPFRQAVVVCQICFAVVLSTLCGGGLKTWQGIAGTAPGFAANGAVALDLSFPSDYPDTRLQNTVEQIVGGIKQFNGVTAAGITNQLPMSGESSIRAFTISSGTPEGRTKHSLEFSRVTPGYFRAIGATLIHGRYLEEQDTAAKRSVALINRKLAGKFFGGRDPIGQVIEIYDGAQLRKQTIVGVVDDIRQFGLNKDVPFEAYLPFSEAPWPRVTLVVRSRDDASASLPAVRKTIAKIDSSVAISNVKTIQEYVRLSTAPQEIITILLSCLAGTSLLLAAIGIYGLVSFQITSRLHEFGIRRALGATSYAIASVVILREFRILLYGSAMGMCVYAAADRVLNGLFGGLEKLDPAVFSYSVLTVVCTGLFASAIPLWRALSVSPSVALKG